MINKKILEGKIRQGLFKSEADYLSKKALNKKCPTCGGIGTVKNKNSEPNSLIIERLCPTCNGNGYVKKKSPGEI